MKSPQPRLISSAVIPLLAFCGLYGLLAPLNSLRAEVKPHPLFTEGAVLQQQVPIPVWGTAGAGEKVTVRLEGQEASTVAGKDGKWKIQLPPREAGGPLVMTISGSNTITLPNVMVGEVWVCAGQSNMAFDLKGTDVAATEIPKANYPKLRIFGVGAKGYALPQSTLPGGKWVECSPQTAGGFTAVGYFFGRDLLKARSVAVGLISTAWCGTPAEAWTSLDGLKKAKELQGYVDVAQKLSDAYPRAMYLLPGQFAQYWDAFTRWNETAGKAYQKAYAEWDAAAKAAKAEGKRPPSPPPAPSTLPPVPPPSPDADEGMPKTPTVIFNGRIAPLTPYAIKGVLWYQAEGNSVKDREPSTEKAMEYRTLFPCLIADWRAKWGLGDFPFLFVQLPAFKLFCPEIREAQLLTLGKSPNTAMAVTADLGQPNELHPTNKEPVGVRLALAARAVAYGEKIEYSGPLFESMKIEGNRAILSFGHTGGGMVAKGGELKGFVIAGADGKFVPAKAGIAGETIVVSSAEVAAPAAVRYCWENTPEVNLYNKEGLPASPFRTDLVQMKTPPMYFGDSTRLGRPFAKDPSVIRFGGRYLMYYSVAAWDKQLAPKDAPRGWAIGIAESRDLVNWKPIGEILPEQECEKNGIVNGRIILLDGKLHLFYNTYGNGAKDALCEAWSEDGLHFTRNPTNPIWNPAGAWNNGRAIDVDVVEWADKLIMYYATRDPLGKIQMLHAIAAPRNSQFNRADWKSLCDGPVLKPELAWEKTCIEAPSVIKRGDTLYLFYGGGYNNAPQQIGCATSKDGIHFQKLFIDKPLLPNGAPGEWNSSESGHPGMFQDEDGQLYMFYQANNDMGRTWFISWVKIGWEGDKPRLF